MNIELVGYAAGLIVAISLSPQVIKSWETKSTKDISIYWTITYLIGLSLWIAYGAGIRSLPLMITIAIEFAMALSLLILKILYK